MSDLEPCGSLGSLIHWNYEYFSVIKNQIFKQPVSDTENDPFKDVTMLC